MRYQRWMAVGLGIAGAATLGLAVRGVNAGEAPPTVTVYKSPT